MTKKVLTTLASAMLFLFVLTACGDGKKGDVVESGTYTGTISEVNAGEREIYVKTPDNKTLELYFTDATNLTQNGTPVEFSALQKGQTVEVTVEKVGKKLDPIRVDIK